MGYRVRTPEGELAYPTLRDVEVAYVQGLVEPNDEVLEDGHSTWRKASSIPALARARPESKGLAGRTQILSVLAAVVLGAGALALIMSDSWPRRGLGIVLALAMSVLLTRLTAKAHKRPASQRD
ncbi:hypothetical protein [Archangium violaceum]|uniref:GYF domain-containing protein n=1 Tax=Archangium violaceum Cb vi76 TaxID=1406225 RepID=A0A084T0N9_9BACT|nr:hypothetical protein [Archangium violaceum]KFA94274.1 hypothetical protein Q664_03715 [Archangium violaceum Cb vi76]